MYLCMRSMLKKNARVIYKKLCARIKLHRPTKINNQTNKA